MQNLAEYVWEHIVSVATIKKRGKKDFSLFYWLSMDQMQELRVTVIHLKATFIYLSL
jgi:hypothetical protein